MKDFLRKSWKWLTFIGVALVGVLIIILTLGSYRPKVFKTSKPAEQTYDPNSVSDNRSEKIGEADKDGNTQINVVKKNEIKPDDGPGVEVKESVSVTPKTDSSDTQNHFVSVFDKPRKKKQDDNGSDQPIRFRD